jgi:DNA-binding NarL/FixJ family response regulator
MYVKGLGEEFLTLRLVRGLKTGDQALLMLQERKAPSASIVSEHGFTQRETEVLNLARRGLSNGDIAGALFISRRTVEKHFENIFSKLCVENRTAAVAAAFSNDIDTDVIGVF